MVVQNLLGCVSFGLSSHMGVKVQRRDGPMPRLPNPHPVDGDSSVLLLLRKDP